MALPTIYTNVKFRTKYASRTLLSLQMEAKDSSTREIIKRTKTWSVGVMAGASVHLELVGVADPNNYGGMFNSVSSS